MSSARRQITQKFEEKGRFYTKSHLYFHIDPSPFKSIIIEKSNHVYPDTRPDFSIILDLEFFESIWKYRWDLVLVFSSLCDKDDY